MSQNHFDKRFKDALYNHSVKAPSGTWDAISAGLESGSGKTRHIPYLPILIGAVLILALGGVVWNSSIQPADHEPADSPAMEEGSGNAMTLGRENLEGLKGEISEAEQANTAMVTRNTPGTEEEGFAAAVSDNAESKTQSPRNSNTRVETPSQPAPTNSSGSGITTGETFNAKEATVSNIATPKFSTTSLPPLKAGLITATRSVDFSEFAVTDCYDFGGKSKGRIAVDIYTGPTYSLKTLKSKNEDVSSYINSRDTTEKSQLSWHAGLRVGFEHQSGFTVRLGGHYTMVNEVFNSSARDYRYQIITDSLFNPIDTILVPGTRAKQTQNRYHSIDIPLLVGYRIENGNWEYGIQAGPAFNIMFDANGDMLDPSGEISSFSEPTEVPYSPVFKERLGLSLYGSLYASKRVGSFTYVFIEPHIHHRFQDIALDNYPIDQRQTNIGLSIGLKMKFDCFK